MNFIPRASLAIFSFAVVTSASAQPAPDRLKTLFEQQWENTLREAPVFATTLGDTRYNDRLSDEGLAAEARRLDSTRVFLARLRAIPRDSLARPDQINRDIMERSLRRDPVRRAVRLSHSNHESRRLPHQLPADSGSAAFPHHAGLPQL